MIGRTVVLELGGSVGRLRTAAQAARVRPGSVLVVSSESEPAFVLTELASHGLPLDRVYLDYAAWDTVSNLTHTRALLEDLGCDEVCVVTSAGHLRRALAIARVVYWGTPVGVVPVPHLDAMADEPWWDVVVDVLRALVWKVTNWVPTMPALKRRELARHGEHAALARRLHDPALVTP